MDRLVVFYAFNGLLFKRKYSNINDL